MNCVPCFQRECRGKHTWFTCSGTRQKIKNNLAWLWRGELFLRPSYTFVCSTPDFGLVLGENTALQDLPSTPCCYLNEGRLWAGKQRTKKSSNTSHKGLGTSEPPAPCREGSCYAPPELSQSKSSSPSCGRELSGTLISDDGTQHRKSRGGRAWERLITPCLLGSDSLKDELFPTWLLKNTY